MQKYEDIDFVLARILLERAIKKRGTFSYKDCADALSKELNRKIHYHGALRMPLYRVADMCFECGVPLLTALVVYDKDYTGTVTGQGFYTAACDYQQEYKKMKPVEAWKTELKRVRLCEDWKRLQDFLNSEGIK